MRFVQVKSAEQQGHLMQHRTRDLLMRQRTQLINALRAHLAELGIVAAQGNAGLKELLKIIAGERDARLPVDAHASLVVLAAGLHAVQTMIGSFDKRIVIEHRSNEASKRLRSIPGIGFVGASAIVATVADPMAFRSGRDLAGLDRANSTRAGVGIGSGSISKRGRYLRSLFVAGALAVIRHAKIHGTKYRPWVAALLARRPTKSPPSRLPTSSPEWPGQ